MYEFKSEALSNLSLLHDPSPGQAVLINPVDWSKNLPRHQAQVDCPYHTKKTSHKQSLVDRNNGEVEYRHKWPKLEAGDHDGPEFLMTSHISDYWSTITEFDVNRYV